MRKVSQSKFVVFGTLISLISVAALTFAFTQRSAAQLRPAQRPVENTVQEKQAVQIRELTADVAELKNRISELRQPFNQLQACCEKQISKADFDKQLFEVKLRLVNLEGVAKDYKTHTHQNVRFGLVAIGGQLAIALKSGVDPKKVENVEFSLGGPVQH
jgi:TolA-binding protein